MVISMFKLFSFAVSKPAQKQGHVFIVGAGPGALDLMTGRAIKALNAADVIIYDALISDEIVESFPLNAQAVFVGKRKGAHSASQHEINALMIAQAKAGKTVVRLKSGDPSVYGRAGEEMAALHADGIAFDIIPGVTAALAAAADAKLSLTQRGQSSSLVFATGQNQHGQLPDWAPLALSGATIAVYMGRSVAGDIGAQLVAAGLAATTPVLAVENASRSDQRLFAGTVSELEGLAALVDVDGPVLILIGQVAGNSLSQALEPLTQSPTEGLFAVLRKAS